MESTKIASIYVLATLSLIGCGGNDSPADSINAFEVSPGGIWQAEATPIQWESPLNLGGQDDAIDEAEFFYLEPDGIALNSYALIDADHLLFIAENGYLIYKSRELNGASVIGVGQITQSDSNGIIGTYTKPNAHAGQLFDYPNLYSSSTECELEGTIADGGLLYLTTSCALMDVTDEISLTLLPSSDCSEGFCSHTLTQYNAPTSLEDIAGDYMYSSPLNRYAEELGLEFEDDTEISISADGTISGRGGSLHCDLEGAFSAVDGSFNLYAIEWTLSNCADDVFNGVIYDGLATYINSESGGELLILLGDVRNETFTSEGIRLIHEGISLIFTTVSS